MLKCSKILNRPEFYKQTGCAFLKRKGDSYPVSPSQEIKQVELLPLSNGPCFHAIGWAVIIWKNVTAASGSSGMGTCTWLLAEPQVTSRSKQGKAKCVFCHTFTIPTKGWLGKTLSELHCARAPTFSCLYSCVNILKLFFKHLIVLTSFRLVSLRNKIKCMRVGPLKNFSASEFLYMT